MKVRIFYFASRLFNDKGEKIIDEDIIKVAVAHRIVKRYAYILHDKDVYSLQDEAEGKGKHGEPKDPHFHLVAELTQMYELETIAKWFNLPSNFINKAKGAGAFLDCVEYLTHESDKEQEAGKYRYSDEEVKANFNFRELLNKRSLSKSKYGLALNDTEILRREVLTGEKTLSQCYAENPDLFIKDNAKLKLARAEYLSHKEPPKMRINYYMSGNGGIGKNCASKALARALFPNIENESDLYFEVGAEDVSFEGYDGQPVIIWNDCRAEELLRKLHGKGNVFTVFDVFPTKQKQSIKYGSINLINSINIVNSVQDYEDFLETLVRTKDGENEDIGQSARRFPFIIPLHEKDFDLLVNKGFFYGTGLFTEWEKYKNIQGNFGKVRKVLRNNEKLAKQIENQMLELPLQKYNEVIANAESDENLTDEELIKQFKNYGKQKTSLQKRMELSAESSSKTDEENL